ncbi:MAG: hypothetical protein K2H73_09215, partial [Treponemataceae bacterium]|nr:hypothetical protein [Treponemataceae bacterium]
MAKNVSKIALLAAAAFMLAFLPACSGDDGESGSSSVAVTDVKVSADNTTLYVSGGDDGPNTATLTAKVAPDNATDKTVTWFPSVTGVAELSAMTNESATVTAKNAGVVTVTAKAANDRTAAVQLTVFENKASQEMFKNIAGTYTVGETSISIDEAGFVTVGDKKSDKPAVVDGSKLTVTIDGAPHIITVASDGSLTLDGEVAEKVMIALSKPDGTSEEYDTIKDALAAIPATGTDTYTLPLQ